MIEVVNESDFDHLFEIECAAHALPWSRGVLLNNRGENYLNLKLSETNRIVAFAICHIAADEATLFNLAVAPAAQGKGYAKRLLAELISQLQTRSVQTLWLEVRESNTVARRLYDSLGFNEVTLRKNYYPTSDGKRENAVVMALSL